jgi:hypothetical protein
MHGYSDSDSEDEIPPPAPAPAAAPAKARKKPRMPPQPRINRMWKHFSTKKFNTTLSVLPFAPVHPAASDGANELLEAGYERAAAECRSAKSQLCDLLGVANGSCPDARWRRSSQNVGA